MGYFGPPISSDHGICGRETLCLLCLFLNIIVDSIFRELDRQISEPSSIVGISYADDIRIASLYHDSLQHALDILLNLFARIGFFPTNVEKTKEAMICLGHRRSQSFSSATYKHLSDMSLPSHISRK
jgi:hypothetical protein